MSVLLFPAASWLNPTSEGPNAVPTPPVREPGIPQSNVLVFRAATTVVDPVWVLVGLAVLVAVLRQR